ncbi:MAG TPA: GFA family protein [Roseibacterium sp.]|nr:GFA family protein [Roseibacterium sp.]
MTYCHCSDCRRLTGAPVAAFAAFALQQVQFTPSKGPRKSVTKGVDRWFCAGCGSQLAATYGYLPGQIYIPLGIIDQAATLQPQGHSHTDSALPWFHIDDTLPRDQGSARVRLQDAGPTS